MRTFLLSVLGLATVVGSASAQPLPTELWAGGVIVKVDTAARTVDVRQGDHQQTYVIAADAEVKDGKKAVQTADLAGSVGQQVRLKYTAAGDARTATRVNLHRRAHVRQCRRHLGRRHQGRTAGDDTPSTARTSLRRVPKSRAVPPGAARLFSRAHRWGRGTGNG